jgi:NADH dehydrogenase
VVIASFIVGGGAGGLELATRLGDKLGKGRKAHVTLIEKKRNHFWKPHLHEIAAGSMDIGVYQTNYLAQAHWHHFRYRIGEVTGLDRAQRTVTVAPFTDEDGDRVTPPRMFPYDTLVVAVGSLTTISARRASRSTRLRWRRRLTPSAFTGGS